MVTSALRAIRLDRMDLPDHACRWGLRAVKLQEERHILIEDYRLTSSAEVEAFKTAHGVVSTPQIGVRPEGSAASWASPSACWPCSN